MRQQQQSQFRATHVRRTHTQRHTACQGPGGRVLFTIATLLCMLLSPQIQAQPGNDIASGDSGLAPVPESELPPDNNASSLLASPITGLLPELPPNAMEDGVCLFLLQVSGRDAYDDYNQDLSQALNDNLSSRLKYVNASNLYLLNYTEVPSDSRRRMLAASSPPPPPVAGIESGVVPLPDLQAEMQNITVQGTGVQIKGPSMTFMYEVVVDNESYISSIHNQLNSIIATSLLLKDVQAADLSISSIYLLAFQPGQPASDNSSATPQLASRPASHRDAFIATSVLIPVAVIIIITAGGYFIWRRHLRHVKGIHFTSRRSSSIDPADSARSASMQMTHADLFESKALTLAGLTPLSSSESYPKLAAAPRESHVKGGEALTRSPPSWMGNVPFSDWEIDLADIVIGLRPDGRKWELGAGAFSKVYRGLLRGVQVVAVKVFNDGPQYTSDSSEERLQTLYALKSQRQTLIKQEIAVLKSCRDRNIVQFVGACIQREQTMLITEYMEGGDLYHAIAQDSTGRFAWYKRDTQQGIRQVGMGRRIALDVARGLHFLHSNKIVHFDLKSANILLARDNTAKIADVGLAKIMHRQFLSSLYNVGTFAWSAPEVLLGKSTCTEKVDMYSYGVVLWEICASEAPTGRQLRPLRVPEECPQAAADVVEQCLHEDPSVRPSAREVVEKLTQLREPSQH